MEGHVAMEWKDPGPESLMGFQTRAVRPDTVAGHSNDDVKAGFAKHGLSVALSSPNEKVRPLPVTPQFGQKSSPGGSLAERMQARTGFKVPKLKMPFSKGAGEADNSLPGAPSPYLTIPPGLSPATLLESPLFISNAMGQPSPTTGKLFLFSSTNDNDPIRFGGPPVEDGSNAFSFKPLDLKSSRYTAEAIKEHNNPVKTEPRTEPVQEAANLLGQLNQQNHNHNHNHNHNVQTTNPKSGAVGPLHDSTNKLSRLASVVTGAGAGGNDEHVAAAAAAPDYGQTAAAAAAAVEWDPKVDYPATVVGPAATAPASEDGYSWRKYGQKQVKHSEYPRSYFKCTHPSCAVKKKVERSQEGHVTEIIYKGAHCHPKPSSAQGRRQQQQQQTACDANANAVVEAGNSNSNNVNHYQAPWRAGGAQPQDGTDDAAAPSVPGELWSPECGGADVTSAVVSDEVDGGDDGVTLGSVVSHGGGADADGDELDSNSKRRKLEAYAFDRSTVSTLSRAVREPRVVIQTTSEVDILDDGYRWRKYGQKVVKGNPNPRSYYKCTHTGCTVRKHVERASHDLKSVITTYEGKHDHEVPAARNSGGGHGHHHLSTQGRSRPEHPSVQDGLMMGRLGGGCAGVPFGLPAPRPPPTAARDPLAPMANYPTYALGCGGQGPTSLPSLPPMPVGTTLGGGGGEGLNIPMLSSMYQHSLLNHRQAMQAAGYVADVKIEGGGAAPAAYQQMVRGRGGLRLGHRM